MQTVEQRPAGRILRLEPLEGQPVAGRDPGYVAPADPQGAGVGMTEIAEVRIGAVDSDPEQVDRRGSHELDVMDSIVPEWQIECIRSEA